MDIAAIEATGGPAGAVANARTEPPSTLSEQRPIGIQVSVAAQLDLASALRSAPSRAATQPGVFAAIDRLRDDFAALDTRLDLRSPSRPGAASGLAGLGPNETQGLARSADGVSLESAMRDALRIQTEVFKLSVGFHAGLSASQQSQNGVKTLIEKS